MRMAEIVVMLAVGAAFRIEGCAHAPDLRPQPLQHVDDDVIIANILTLVDSALIGALLLIIGFSGYENFVSKIATGQHEDRPAWMAVWLMIIADNTIHLAINAAAVLWL